MTPEQNEQVESLLKKHIDVFSTHDADIGDCDMIRHRIDLIESTPFKQKHRRIPPAMIDDVRKHIEELYPVELYENQNLHGVPMWCLSGRNMENCDYVLIIGC